MRKQIRNLLLRTWNRVGRVFDNRHFVLILENEEDLEFPTDAVEEFISANSMEGVPDWILKMLLCSGGPGYEKTMADRFARKARLYASIYNGEFGSMIWARSGADIEKWFMSLGQDDFVLFGGYTNPKFRGKHLNSHVIAVAYNNESKQKNRCFTDCSVNNVPSIRQFERTGFRKILKCPPLRR